MASRVTRNSTRAGGPRGLAKGPRRPITSSAEARPPLAAWHLVQSRKRRLRSGQDSVDDVAADIGKLEVAALKAKCQSLVVDAEQVQHGGMEVMHGDHVLDGVVAQLVGRSVADAALDAAARQPH